MIEGGEASLGVLTVLSENPGIQEGSGHFFKQCQHRMPAAREQILPAEEEHPASIESTAVPPNRVTKNLAHNQKLETVPKKASWHKGILPWVRHAACPF